MRKAVLPWMAVLPLVAIMSNTSVAIAAGEIYAASPVFPEVVQSYYSSEFLVLTNEIRQEAGMFSLRLNPQLEQAALAKAADMVAKGYWEHFRPVDHKAPWDFIHEAGYDYVVAGENLARGFRTPQGITQAWNASPTHRANLISSKYTEVGFACVETVGKDGRPILITVQLFGSR